MFSIADTDGEVRKTNRDSASAIADTGTEDILKDKKELFIA